MMIISLTTIIAGAAVVLLAVLGSLINPFLRSLRLNKEEEQSAEGTTEDAAASQPLPPVTILSQLMTTFLSWNATCILSLSRNILPTIR